MSMNCLNFKAFTKAQSDLVGKAIDENKWYLSEKAKCDVGNHEAQRDFIENHCKQWAAGFRAGFCAACPYRDSCGTEF
jgi:hypothetical protein